MTGGDGPVSGVRKGVRALVITRKEGRERGMLTRVRCQVSGVRFVYVSPKINTLPQVPKSNGIFVWLQINT